MAIQEYIEQSVQMCSNALRHPQFLTPRQKQTFRRFIQDVVAGKDITDKQLKSILRQIKK